jgi:hypothetical protein
LQVPKNAEIYMAVTRHSIAARKRRFLHDPQNIA